MKEQRTRCKTHDVVFASRHQEQAHRLYIDKGKCSYEDVPSGE